MIDLGALKMAVKVDNKEANSNLEDTKGKFEGLKTASKALAAGMATAFVATGAAVVSLVKSATESYSEYEQLVGGMDTLFKDSSNKIQGYAEQAYKTAQISANDYMNLATSFSASLLQSLGGDTEKAADYANSAIIDMSDNANKMGTSMESIQNAYQGFSKQNYTMLDNLKLGYGGTKEEMQRLLTDAEKISGIKYDISSFSDITQAIHVMQEQMGIAGTSAKEASTTIQGSFAMTKSAFSDLVRAFGDKDADITPYIDNVIESATQAFNNLLPVVKRVIEQLGNALPSIVNVIAEQLPPLVAELLPQLMEGITTLLDALIANLPIVFSAISTILMSAINYVVENLPLIINLALQLIITLANGIVKALPTLIPSLIDCILTIVDNLTSPETLLQLVDAGIQLIIGLTIGLIEAIPRIIEKIPVIIDNLINALIGAIPMIIDAGIQLFIALVQNLPAIIKGIIKAIPQIISALINGFGSYYSEMGGIGLNLIKGIWNGIKDAGSWLWEKIKGFFGGITDKIKDFFGIHSPSRLFASFGDFMVQGLGNGITDNVDYVTKAVDDLNESIADEFEPNINVGVNGNMATVLKNNINPSNYGIINGSRNVSNQNNESMLFDKLPELMKKMGYIKPSAINTSINIDGREFAIATSPYIGEELAF